MNEQSSPSNAFTPLGTIIRSFGDVAANAFVLTALDAFEETRDLPIFVKTGKYDYFGEVQFSRFTNIISSSRAWFTLGWIVAFSSDPLGRCQNYVAGIKIRLPCNASCLSSDINI